MGLLNYLTAAGRDKRRWMREEREWVESGAFPRIVVRAYRSERQLRRDARRLRKLGYTIKFQTLGRERAETWYVTYSWR